MTKAPGRCCREPSGPAIHEFVKLPRHDGCKRPRNLYFSHARPKRLRCVLTRIQCEGVLTRTPGDHRRNHEGRLIPAELPGFPSVAVPEGVDSALIRHPVGRNLEV